MGWGGGMSEGHSPQGELLTHSVSRPFCPSPVSSRRRATSSVNSRLFRLTRLYMMRAQKLMAPKMARTLRDICSDSEACPVQESMGSAAEVQGKEDMGAQRSWGCAHL